MLKMELLKACLFFAATMFVFKRISLWVKNQL